MKNRFAGDGFDSGLSLPGLLAALIGVTPPTWEQTAGSGKHCTRRG